MQQKMVSTTREVKARRVPTGEPKVIPKGEFVNITQDLGGNYTVTFQGNMLRIDGTDADAIGRKPEKLDFPVPDDGKISEQQVWDALETIYDPEIPVNIYELGLIYDIQVSEDCDVEIEMTLTSPNCPVAESLPVEVEEKVSEIKTITSVKVNIVFEPPWTKDMMSEEAKLELGML